MKTVGQILQNKRIEKKLSVDEVEKLTKIRRKFIQALESDSFSTIPSQTYTKGFIKNYAQFLGLDSAMALAFYRRQTHETPKSSLLPRDTDQVLKPSQLRLTPTRFLLIVAGFLIIVFLSYFGWQYKTIQSPPLLFVETPLNGYATDERRVDVTGKTDSDATIVVNGVGVLVRSDGKFFEQVSLDSGENTITIMATSRFGKSISIIRSVVRTSE